MKPLTREWVDKAEGDFHSCERETRARRYPNYDSACSRIADSCESRCV